MYYCLAIEKLLKYELLLNIYVRPVRQSEFMSAFMCSLIHDNEAVAVCLSCELAGLRVLYMKAN